MKQQKTVTVGFISGLSGVYGWMAQDQLAGVKLAVDEINAAHGIAGRQLRVVVKDDKSDSKLAQTGTRELIEKDGADFVIGSLSAGTHLFINSETKKAGKIFMSIGQSNEITMAPHLGPYTFHEALTPYMTVNGIGRWVFERLGKKWFLVIADYEWGHHMRDAYTALAKQLGAALIGVVAIPFPAKSANDFTRHFPKIIAAAPDVLVIANYGLDQLKFIEAANAAGLKRKMSIVHTLSEIDIIGRIKPKEAVGMYWGASFYWELADTLSTAKGFVSAYSKRYRKFPSGYSAYGYSGALELLGRAQELGIYPLDSDAIARDLEGRTYAHYKNSQWWRPCDHQSFQDCYVLKLKGPEERKGRGDISEIVGVTHWDIDMERTCEDLGHAKRLWGNYPAPVNETTAPA